MSVAEKRDSGKQPLQQQSPPRKDKDTAGEAVQQDPHELPVRSAPAPSSCSEKRRGDHGSGVPAREIAEEESSAHKSASDTDLSYSTGTHLPYHSVTNALSVATRPVV